LIQVELGTARSTPSTHAEHGEKRENYACPERKKGATLFETNNYLHFLYFSDLHNINIGLTLLYFCFDNQTDRIQYDYKYSMNG